MKKDACGRFIIILSYYRIGCVLLNL